MRSPFSKAFALTWYRALTRINPYGIEQWYGACDVLPPGALPFPVALFVIHLSLIVFQNLPHTPHAQRTRQVRIRM